MLGRSKLNAQNLNLFGNAQITTGTFSGGEGGNIRITGEYSVILDGAKAAIAAQTGGGAGNAGAITIATPTLEIRNGAFIDSTTSGVGDGGAVNITANKSIIIEGTGSGLLAQTGENGGNAGEISISATSLEIKNDAVINTTTFGNGTGGNTLINAGNVIISNGGVISGFARGNGKGGDITINTDFLGIVDGLIGVTTRGNGEGGKLKISANNSIILDGLRSGLFAQGVGRGNAGEISIETPLLQIEDGAKISASTFGVGEGGSIKINADLILADRHGLVGNQFNTGIFANSQSASNSNAGIGGKITIGKYTADTNQLKLIGGAEIVAKTTSINRGGNIIINSDFITIDSNNSGLISSINTSSDLNEGLEDTSLYGDAGNVEITSQILELKGASIISSTTTGGQGGNITVFADSIVLDKSGSSLTAGIVSETHEKTAGGNSGTITIETENFDILRGGLVSTRTRGSGNAGNIIINSDFITFDSNHSGLISSINTSSDLDEGFEDTSLSGDAGNVEITSQNLELKGAVIISSTFTGGQGGNITVFADSIVLDENGSSLTTGIGSETHDKTAGGNSGTITIETRSLDILRGGLISTRTRGSGNAGNITVNANGPILIDGRKSPTQSGILSSSRTQGTVGISGFAGDITINSTERIDMITGAVNTLSLQSSAGNIEVDVPVLIMNDSSQITAEAGVDGGNVNLTTDAIVMNRAVISANANQGNGGNIIIDTKGILENHDKVNQITASSELGISGNITISAPDVDLTASLVPLSEDFLEVDSWALSSCATKFSKGEIGSFTVSPFAGDSLLIDDLLPSASFMENGDLPRDEVMMNETEREGEFSVSTGMDCSCVEIGE